MGSGSQIPQTTVGPLGRWAFEFALKGSTTTSTSLEVLRMSTPEFVSNHDGVDVKL